MTTKQLRQFSPSQQEKALDLIDSLTWGDLRPAIGDIDECLRRALKATESVAFWEDGFEQRFGDEFSLSDAQVEGLSDEDRRAYVARLIETLALMYGLWFGRGRGESGEVQANSPAGLLHGLAGLFEEGN
jgi:hypothetical protein